MKIFLNTTEVKCYSIEVPDKYFKKLNNPIRRTVLLDYIHEMYNDDEFTDEWTCGFNLESITDEDGLDIFSLSTKEIEYFNNR